MYITLSKITKWTCTSFIYEELGPLNCPLEIGAELAYLDEDGRLVILGEKIMSLTQDNYNSNRIFVNDYKYMIKKVEQVNLNPFELKKRF